MSMVLADEGKFGVAPTNKCDEDVDMLIKHPLGIPVADGRSLAPTGPLAYQDRPNSYGTFPRVLGRYVRERGVLTWEEAVQKMAAIPASRVGLWDRGVLREGMAADIVIFDPETVIEKADYANPQEYPDGMPWVIVNGKVTVAPGGPHRRPSGLRPLGRFSTGEPAQRAMSAPDESEGLGRRAPFDAVVYFETPPRSFALLRTTVVP